MDFQKKQAPKQPMRMIRKITDGSWRTFATVPQAPPKLNALLIQCLEVKPQDRPTFEQILSEMSGPIKSEIDESNFKRQPAGSYGSASGLYGSSDSSGGYLIDSNESNDGIFDRANSADKNRLKAASSLQQQGVTSDSDYARPGSQGVSGLAEAEAEYMRNPMLPAAARSTDKPSLSDRFSQNDRSSELELSRVEVVTHTEV